MRRSKFAKILSLLLVALLAVSALASCTPPDNGGEGTPAVTTDASTPEATKRPIITRDPSVSNEPKPTEEIPEDNTPTQGTPTQGTPTQGTPTQETPVTPTPGGDTTEAPNLGDKPGVGEEIDWESGVA